MAYQLQEINKRVQNDVQEFLAECDENYALRISLAADRIISNLEHSPIVLLSGPSGSGKTTTALKLAEEPWITTSTPSTEKRLPVLRREISITNLLYVWI